MEITELENPRICNTGVQNTNDSEKLNDSSVMVCDYSEKGELKSLIDWCEFTIPISQPLEKVFDILGIPQEGNFHLMPEGKKLLGYSEIYINGHIKVMTGGTAQMGHHVMMSGQGCREYELFVGMRWRELFTDIILVAGKFSRLDVAIDDFHGYFKIPDLIEKIKKGELVSKFKKARRIEDILISDGSTQGNTLYYGSGKSELQIRMYEKNHEQELAEEVSIWNRTEIQLRNDRASFFATAWVSDNVPVGQYVQGVLANYISFRDTDPNDCNKSRWDVSAFWLDFLMGVDKLKLTTKKPDRSIERIEKWMDHQVNKSMAILATVKPEIIARMIVDGSKKFSEEDEILIGDYMQQRAFLRDLMDKKREDKKRDLLKPRRSTQK